MAQRFDAARARLSGEASPVGPQVYRLQSTWRGNFDASKNGMLTYYSAAGQRGSQLFWVDANGNTITALGEGAFIHDLTLSPDGRKLAVGAGDPSSDFWTDATLRGKRSRVTFDGINRVPIWSPDGPRIAFAKRHGGLFDIYIKRADGTGSKESVYASAESKVVWDWTPDGKSLLVGMGHPSALWLVPLSDEHKAQPLVRGPYSIYEAAFSPDGRWLAYDSTRVVALRSTSPTFLPCKGNGRSRTAAAR
jgi:Tol biopolymer transport system component